MVDKKLVDKKHAMTEIITAQSQWGWGGGFVGVRGGDTDDTFHTNTFHTILQHPTEAVLHSSW